MTGEKRCTGAATGDPMGGNDLMMSEASCVGSAVRCPKGGIVPTMARLIFFCFRQTSINVDTRTVKLLIKSKINGLLDFSAEKKNAAFLKSFRQIF